ncbi:MAG: KR domain-containing protein, partial [Thermoanaerobaculia bacterium]
GTAAAPTVVGSLPDRRRGGSEAEHWLSAVGQLWSAGYAIDWRAFDSAPGRRVTLPAYPFERRRYWLEAVPRSAGETPDREHDASPRQTTEPRFHLPYWRPSAPAPQWTATAAETPTPCLLLADDGGLGERVARQLETAGHEPIVVRRGESFQRLGERQVVIDPGRPQDYDRLLSELADDGRAPAILVHLWSLDADGRTDAAARTFRRAQDLGLYSALLLARAAIRAAPASGRRLFVVSSSARSFDGEAARPEQATLWALPRVLPWESSDLHCQAIDVAPPPAASPEQEELAGALVGELLADRGRRQSLVALRRGRRWVEDFTAVSPAAQPAPALRRRGVYVITGGLGHLGLLFAEYLATAAQARLVLLGRSPFPSRDEWSGWLETHGDEDRISRKILRLRACEQAGAEIFLGRADVSDERRLTTLLADVRRRVGPPNGVIHAAGLAGERALGGLVETGPETCEAQFRSKAYGLLTLDKVLRQQGAEELDFCLLFSSLASLLGGPGFCAYTAANLFLDAFAHRCRDGGGLPWTSLCWDAWQGSSGTAARVAAALGIDRSGEIFTRVLALAAEPRVLISCGELEPRLEPLRPRPVDAGAKDAGRHPRPPLGNPYVAPRNAAEAAVAEIWQELLGIENVGVDDDFFELGGDSLMAVDLASRLLSHMQLGLPLRSFFEAPTVAGIAAVLPSEGSPSEISAGADEAWEGAEDAELAELLGEIKSLSSDEIEAELALRNAETE